MPHILPRGAAGRDPGHYRSGVEPIDAAAGIGELISWLCLVPCIPVLLLGLLLRARDGHWTPVEIVVVLAEGRALARWYAGLDASLTSTGSSNAYVVTTGSSHAALADIGLLVFVANHTNTGAATLAVDGLTAKPIQKRKSESLDAGDIVEDGVYVVIYNSEAAAFELLNPTDVARGVPKSSETSGTLTVASKNRWVKMTDDITIDPNVFSEGDIILILNNSGASKTITQGTNMNLRLAGTTTSGSRTISVRGLAAIMFASATNAYVGGTVT